MEGDIMKLFLLAFSAAFIAVMVSSAEEILAEE